MYNLVISIDIISLIVNMLCTPINTCRTDKNNEEGIIEYLREIETRIKEIVRNIIQKNAKKYEVRVLNDVELENKIAKKIKIIIMRRKLNSHDRDNDNELSLSA